MLSAFIFSPFANTVDACLGCNPIFFWVDPHLRLKMGALCYEETCVGRIQKLLFRPAWCPLWMAGMASPDTSPGAAPTHHCRLSFCQLTVSPSPWGCPPCKCTQPVPHISWIWLEALQSSSLPPLFSSKLIFFHLWLQIRQEEELNTLLSWSEKYSPVFTRWFGGFMPVLVITHPDFAKAVFGRGGKGIASCFRKLFRLILPHPKCLAICSWDLSAWVFSQLLLLPPLYPFQNS